MSDPARKPKTLDEFGCWLNCWANEKAHVHYTLKEQHAYERAVSDILQEFDKLNPGWLTAWPDWEGLPGKLKARR